MIDLSRLPKRAGVLILLSLICAATLISYSYVAGAASRSPLQTGPRIDGLSPSSIARSGLLRIGGAGFGETQGASLLTVGGLTPHVISWTDTQITAYVPEGAPTGEVSVEVTTGAGVASSALVVTVRQPSGRIRWSFDVASDLVRHRAAVAGDGTVYLNDVAGRLYALSADGGLRWIFQAGARGGVGPVSVGADGTVYVAGSVPKDPAQVCADANVTQVDAVFAVNPDGTQKWVFDDTCQGLIAGPNTGPDGRVYAVTNKGGLGAFALSAEGALDWNAGNFSEANPTGFEIVFGTSAAGEPRQFFQFSQNDVHFQAQLFAYSLTGTQVWARGTSKGAQPAVGPASSNVFFSTEYGPGGQIRSYTPGGVHRWFSNIYPEVHMSVLDSGPDDTVYVAQDNYFLNAIDPGSGSIRWTYHELTAVFGPPVASPDNRLVLSGGKHNSGRPGLVWAVGINGALLWKQQLPDVPGLFPGGQAIPSSRARFTADGQTAYLAADVAGDESLPTSERRALFFALDTSSVAAPANRPPTVTLTYPPHGAYVGQNQNAQLTADAFDDSVVTRVDFFRTRDGVTTNVGTDFSAPYSVPFNTGEPGNSRIQAVATDNTGLTSASASNELRVVNEGPRLSFITPTEGQWFPAGEPINIRVRATDPDGQVVRVEFSSSRAGPLPTATTPDENGVYEIVFHNPPTGTQQIWAHPVDDDGHRGLTYVQITVGGTPPPTPTPTPTPTPPTTPGVRILSPAHGSSFATGTPVQITVEALDPDGAVADVKVFRAPAGTLLGTDATAPFQFTLSAAQPTVYDLYAVATDDAGNTMTSSVVQLNFYDPEAPHFINGQIRHAQSTPGNPIYLRGALVKLRRDGQPFRETRADAFGNYTFDHLPTGGSYQVVPSEPDYFFAPPSASVAELAESRTFDFTADGPLPPPLPPPPPGPGASVLAWERFFDNGQLTNDLDSVLTVDGDGNTIVAVKSGNPTGSEDYDILTVKYDSAGQRLWTRRYAGAGASTDTPAAVRADANGNVYVFGTEHGGPSSHYNFVTVKYAPDGAELWARTYNGPLGRWDWGVAMELDAAGNCIVTGYSETTYPDAQAVVNEIATVKYDPLGNQKWANRHTTARVSDQPADLTVDAAGNVYVTGSARTQLGGAGNVDALTIKYTPNGARAWAAQYNGKAGVAVFDAGVSVRHDGRGGLYVAGDSEPGATFKDYFLAKLNDATGALQWSRNWAGPNSDNVKGMAVDAAGRVVVTGESFHQSEPSDVVTVKFDGAGNQLWARTFAGTSGQRDFPRRVVTDAVGNVYVGARVNGTTPSLTETDTAVIKYLADGTEAWAYQYPYGTRHTLGDVAIDAAGSLYATGYVRATRPGGTGHTDINTFKLLASGPGLNLSPEVVLIINGVMQSGRPQISGEQTTLPSGPTVAGASLTLDAQASDSDGVVSRVDFYDGATHLGADTTPPYRVVWHDPPPGTHTITAVATDNFGATRASQPETVTIPGGPTPTPTPTNLALGRPATQSSDLFGGVAARAVDGNTSGVWSGNSVTHTNNNAQPWWQVDLGAVQQLQTVRLWNRTDCCANRLSNFYVLVSDVPFASTGLSATLAQAGVSSYHTPGPAGSSVSVSVNRTGRYVRVQLAATDYLALAEVEVLGVAGATPAPTPTNLAQGKPATQSSDLFGGVAARAADGNTNGAWGGGSVTHTDSGAQPWWEVDLGAVQQLRTVRVWNRTDCCSNRLSNFYVLVSDAPFASTSLSATLAQAGVSAFHTPGPAGTSISINVNRTGRYVRVQLAASADYLSLAEVEVSGVAGATPTTTPAPTNLAHGRPAAQSSDLYGGVAARAADGNTNGLWSNGSVTHTNSQAQPWWEVDLGAVNQLQTVRVWNRTDCCSNRLSNFYVLVSDAPFASTSLSATLAQAGVSAFHVPGPAGSSISINVNRTGRYVRVQLAAAADCLALAEVEVLGVAGTHPVAAATGPAVAMTLMKYDVSGFQVGDRTGSREAALGADG
jgi:hypothetical protein